MAQITSQKELDQDRLSKPEPDDFGRSISRAKHGDSSGFVQLFEHFNRPISALVRSDGSPDPDGTVNAIFAKAFRSIDRFVGTEGNFASYLYQIARYQCIDERRARSRQVRPIESVADNAAETAVEAVMDEQTSRADRINDALQSLTPEQREVIVLRVFFRRTGPETAQALEKSLADIRSLQNRAETRLGVLTEPEDPKL